HDGTGRHVDSKREGFCRKNCAHQALHEEVLDDMPECRQHPCVVSCKTTRQSLSPLAEIQYLEVFFRDAFHTSIDDGLNLFGFLFRGQRHALPQELIQRAFTSSTRENKSNCWEHILPLQHFEDIRAT